MSYIENIYICLAAPLLLALLCLRKAARQQLIFLLAGMTACLLSSYVSSFLAGALGVDLAVAVHEIAPLVEETIKFLPLLFYMLVFEPDKRTTVSGAMLIAVGFATFENVCFLTSYGSSNLLLLLIRGFGTGAMHAGCGMVVAVGLFFLWDQAWLRTVGVFALFCLVIRFHAIFNLFVNQTGAVFWIGSAIPLTMMLVYLLFFHRKVDLSS